MCGEGIKVGFLLGSFNSEFVLEFFFRNIVWLWKIYK